ncbi:MAG: flavodoxin [Candidatus Omnitrophica bacterium]|nr:flavodoxin [Candidatus Omnitrophota bacterium]
MTGIIVYHSAHHQNTAKVADAMAQVAGCQAVRAGEIDPGELTKYEVAGFGSGIYFGRHHRILLRWVEQCPALPAQVFIFSTSGRGTGGKNHRALREMIRRRGCRVRGEFACKGYDTFGPLKLFGGIHRGKPDHGDIRRAREFAMRMNADLPPEP